MWWIVGVVIGGGCDRGGQGEPVDIVPTGPECTPEITVPGPLGELLGRGPEAHTQTFGPEPEPYAVRYGWPGSDPSTAASFLWRTGTDTLATVVEYGIGESLTERVEGQSFRFGGDPGGEGLYRIHEVKLCGGLQPATTYSYRVGGGDHFSPIYQFTTAPEPGPGQSVRVAIAGDSRGAYETWGTLVQLMEQHEPDFYVFSGDMVEFGTLQEEWDSWFAAAGDVLARKALVPAHGNHEFLSANYFAQFSLPNNEQWFSVRYGDLQLLSLNDTVQDEADRTVHQVEFQRGVLSASDAGYTLVTHHQSAFATCTRHGSDERLRGSWVPVWDEFGVDVVVAGHNHIYERSVPIRGGAEVGIEAGTTYLVTGGAGAPLYDEWEDDWFSNVVDPVEHYIIADFGPTGAEFVVRDLVGNVIDSFTIPR
ncbi:MAG TPA: metallophosphoesterase family protein [Deltaproteobacteria bacterium]|nr:metallophosphoesterase family protein [Deltaproteobacteria bacterium]